MEENRFISISALLCEPTRAKIVWNLLDGRAYTASELALVSDVSPTSISNHLSKLLKGDILKVDVQGRHRYYSFASPEVAYAVESLANLAKPTEASTPNKTLVKSGVKYCRTCYDHLAGYVGVATVEGMEKRKVLEKSASNYLVTEKGWGWFSQFDISKEETLKIRRPLTRQCLDWSERRPHLAGWLGAVLLQKTLQMNWFKKVQFSRELVITSKGRLGLQECLGLVLD